MTLKELREKLASLSDQQFEQLVKDFGGVHGVRESLVRSYVDNPTYERRLCQLLDVETQEEKLTAATMNAAEASLKAAHASESAAKAAESNARTAETIKTWTIVYVVATIVMVAVSVIGLICK